jgi:uncharacterized LabA/DUF88 family protein
MSGYESGRGVILMDGGYVENVSDVAKAEHGAEADIEKLSARLAEEFQINHVRTKFYHAFPYQDDTPTEKQQELYAKRKSLYDAIDRKDDHEFVDRGEVKKGREKCWDCGNHWDTYSQKGVDVGIAVDLVDIAHRGKLDSVVLVSGDGDLVHAVESAKNAYVNVYVAYCDEPDHTISYAENITTEADQSTQITVELLRDCLRTE